MIRYILLLQLSRKFDWNDGSMKTAENSDSESSLDDNTDEENDDEKDNGKVA